MLLISPLVVDLGNLGNFFLRDVEVNLEKVKIFRITLEINLPSSVYHQVGLES